MKFFEKLLFPNLDWIQLEISGLCNASCFYCPHTIYRKKWIGKNFSLKDFYNIVPYLKKVKLLYLQGWGEPFLNPNFFDFVEIAKKEGCIVGTTTNGMLIGDKEIDKIIDSGLDIIAFSLTGIKKNDLLREGTKIEKILTIINILHKKRINKGLLTPKIHIAYLLLSSNYDEIEDIPTFFSNSGIDHIVISLLDLIPDSSFESESLIPKNIQEYNLLTDKLERITIKGKKEKLEISFNIPHPHKKSKVCSERALSALFINSLGYVSPCIFTGIPAEDVKNLYFGNIKNKNLYSIWNSKEYKKFREDYIIENPPSPCNFCNKFRIIHS